MSAAAPATPPPGTDYPGKTLGIVGLVLAIVVGGLPGLIVSAVARSQSTKAGYKNTPATVGIILGIIFLVIWVIAVIGIIALSAAAASAGYVTTN